VDFDRVIALCELRKFLVEVLHATSFVKTTVNLKLAFEIIIELKNSWLKQRSAEDAILRHWR
jgi:hypothetical protein